MRYYFHLEDGVTVLDEEGTDFNNMDEVRQQVIETSGEMLKTLDPASLWSGKPWTLWVTDQSDGKGTTFLTLRFAAS